MDKALAYAISALIVGFGVWILIAGQSSSASALCAVAGLLPIVIGLENPWKHPSGWRKYNEIKTEFYSPPRAAPFLGGPNQTGFVAGRGA